MARYIVSIETRMPPAEAFAYMADVTNFPEWDPGVVHVRPVPGTGPGPGAAYDLTVHAGAKTVMRYEVKAFEPPRRVLLVARTPFLVSEDEVRVEATASGSTVTYDAKLTFRGPLTLAAPLLDPMLGVAFRRLGDRAAAGLRRVLAAKGTRP